MKFLLGLIITYFVLKFLVGLSNDIRQTLEDEQRNT